MRKRLWMAAVFLLGLTGLASADNVITYHNSNLRHGAYIVHKLTRAAAATMHRDTGFNATLSGHIYAQPLVWKPQGESRGYVIVATENNIVYALNESTGAIVWQNQLPPSVPLSEHPCGNIDPMGITGTPAIDPAAGILYFDAQIETANGPRHMVYALSLADGSVVPGWPLDVQAALTARQIVFDSVVEGERSAVLFFNDKLYVNYASNSGDCGQYHGTVIEVQTSSPAITGEWQTRKHGGGIWAQGGIAGDGVSLFVTTGNTSGATAWADGEAIIRLHAGLAHSTRRKDYFTPANWKDLDDSDKDLGGTEALPITISVPGQSPAKRVIAFGKDGNAYLTDRSNLGGIGGQLATLLVSDGAIRTAPAVYQTSDSTMVAFTSRGGAGCDGKNVTMLKIAASGPSPISIAWCTAFFGQGAPIVTTTDGTSDPIVWVVGAEGDNLLHGYDALTGQSVFSGTGTDMVGLHHFVTIVAAQSHFYVAADNTVYAFAFGP